MNNFVAKHCRTFNKATVQRDRTKFHRQSLAEELREEDWTHGLDESLENEDDWLIITNEEDHLPDESWNPEDWKESTSEYGYDDWELLEEQPGLRNPIDSFYKLLSL